MLALGRIHGACLVGMNGSYIWSLSGWYGGFVDMDLEWLVWPVHRYGSWWVDMD